MQLPQLIRFIVIFYTFSVSDSVFSKCTVNYADITNIFLNPLTAPSTYQSSIEGSLCLIEKGNLTASVNNTVKPISKLVKEGEKFVKEKIEAAEDMLTAITIIVVFFSNVLSFGLALCIGLYIGAKYSIIGSGASKISKMLTNVVGFVGYDGQTNAGADSELGLVHDSPPFLPIKYTLKLLEKGKQGSRTVIQVFVCEQKFKAMLEEGSPFSFIGMAAINKLGLRHAVENDQFPNVEMYGGHKFIGYIFLNIQFGHHTHDTRVYVSDDSKLVDDFIMLGADHKKILNENGIIHATDLHKQQLHVIDLNDKPLQECQFKLKNLRHINGVLNNQFSDKKTDKVKFVMATNSKFNKDYQISDEIDVIFDSFKHGKRSSAPIRFQVVGKSTMEPQKLKKYVAPHKLRAVAFHPNLKKL